MTDLARQPAPAIGSVVILSRCAWTMYRFRRHLLLHLKEQGVDVLSAGAGGDGYEAPLGDLGIRFVPLPLSMRGISVIAEFRLMAALLRLYRRTQPCVVHAFTIKPVIFGTLAAAMAGVPVRVATITGLGYAFTSSHWSLRYLVMVLYRLALRFAHRVYFQNTTDRDDFLRLKLVAPDKVRLIAGSGVAIDEFSPGPERPTGTSELTFVMVARLLREKGVYEYLHAAERVQRLAPATKFLLVGGIDTLNPTSLSEEEARAASEAAGVTWVGMVDDVRPYLAMADVVVLPSYREGTPMTLLEAAATAKPIIATDVPGCTQVVEDGINGFLVKARDSDGLAEAMLRCVKDPGTLPRMGKEGRKLVEQKFDVRLVSSQILGDYNDLCAQNCRSS